MKRTFYTIGSLIILLICAFVFVLLPAMVGKGGNSNLPAFGKYNGKEIRYEQDSDFANFVQQYGQYYQSMGMQIDSSNYYYIFNYAFNSTVSKMLYTDEVNKSGWKPSVEEVNRTMRPYFNDESGNYSAKLYKQTPESSITKIRSEIEASLVTQRYTNDMFGSDSESLGGTALYGLKESDAELDFLVNYGKEKRGFDMVAFEKGNYPEEKLAEFGKENNSKFIKYDMSVISVESESEAKKIVKRLNAEEISFDDAVAEYSTKDISTTEGKLISSYSYQLENIFEDGGDFATVTALSNGQISAPVKTTSGYAIFRADSASTAPDFDTEESLSMVQSYLNTYESSVIENYYIAKAKDLIADASLRGFDAACEAAGVEKVSVEPFPLNFGNVSVTDTMNTSIQGLSYANENENFLTTAFSLKLNEYSEPIVLGTYVIVLQYVQNETVDTYDDAVLSELENYDQTAASAAIMSSPKLENNFMEVYFQNMMN